MTDEELLRFINLSQQPGRSDKVLASNFAVVAAELHAKRRLLEAAERKINAVRRVADGVLHEDVADAIRSAIEED